MNRDMMTEKLRLFCLGFLTLFLELLLIRYLAGTIWNLGYFPNLVLLSVFIGMGLGFLFHRVVPERLSSYTFQAAPALLALLIAFVVFKHPSVPGFSGFGAEIGGELYFTATAEHDNSYLVFILCFVGLVIQFACISQYTAKLFRRFPPLVAYTLDIGGSCAGILTFLGISLLGLQPFIWFTILIPLFLIGLGSARLRYLPLVPLSACVLLSAYQDVTLLREPRYGGPLEVRWSPYQRLEFLDYTPDDSLVFANGIDHQVVLPRAKLEKMYYRIPYERRAARQDLPRHKQVLVMGAGSGNDVSMALLSGAEHVDAVEIDPVIAGIGKAHHPVHPYDDPRVTLTIDDARAFMTRTPRKYDLIIFALTDSLVKVSSMAQLRLENYLFTRESVARAAALLTEHGEIVLYNHYRTPWLLTKLQRMVHAATGRFPVLVHKENDLGVLMLGADTFEARPPATATIDIPTDDWPFLYLQGRGIPAMYAVAMAGVAALIVALLVVLQGTEKQARGAALRDRLAFLLMGVAFLLLETKSIVQFSLLFGTTWINSSLVFLAVLGLVLLANWAATLLKTGDGRVLWGAYGLLIGSCLVTLLYPLSNLLSLGSPVLRFLLASLMTFSPIFFANLIFSVAFRAQEVPEQVFGWNLIGATLGGVVEYASMATGYNALALIVAVCYTVVFGLLLFGRRAAPSPVQSAG